MDRLEKIKERDHALSFQRVSHRRFGRQPHLVLGEELFEMPVLEYFSAQATCCQAPSIVLWEDIYGDEKKAQAEIEGIRGRAEKVLLRAEEERQEAARIEKEQKKDAQKISDDQKRAAQFYLAYKERSDRQHAEWLNEQRKEKKKEKKEEDLSFERWQRMECRGYYTIPRLAAVWDIRIRGVKNIIRDTRVPAYFDEGVFYIEKRSAEEWAKLSSRTELKRVVGSLDGDRLYRLFQDPLSSWRERNAKKRNEWRKARQKKKRRKESNE